MTIAEKLQNEIDDCTNKAIKCFKNKDFNMCKFWRNASIGLKENT